MFNILKEIKDIKQEKGARNAPKMIKLKKNQIELRENNFLKNLNGV